MTTVETEETPGHSRPVPSKRMEANTGHAKVQSEYLFDVTLSAAIRLKARNEAEARMKIGTLLDCAPVHFGELAGEPVTGEAYLVGPARLAEVSGQGI